MPTRVKSPEPAPAGYRQVDLERLVAEGDKSAERSQFARDRARVVHSAALRRLGDKTQVSAPGSDDFGRTRLTHSLEVAQVGRELGQALGCDPDVVDTACLAHDLGHPPFGHNGESALAALARPAGGFEGNAQTLRVLTRLEPKVVDPVSGRSVGLNLTRACLDAATKYPWGQGEAPAGVPERKFGCYRDDQGVFTWLRRGAPSATRCIEAQVMDLADDISYSVHDVEDAIVSGRLDPRVLESDMARADVVDCTKRWYRPNAEPSELGDALERLVSWSGWVRDFDASRMALAQLKNMTSQLIGRFVTATEVATRSRHGEGPLTRYSADLVTPPAALAEIAVLKGVAAWYVMEPRASDPAHTRERRILTELVEALVEQAPRGLEPAYASDWHAAGDDAARLRAVLDQVASLTDTSAHLWHTRIVQARRY